MIDHVLGRPSVKFRKIQVFAVVSFWSFYLFRGDRHGPPVLRRISSLLSRKLTAWQTLVITLLWLYLARNFGKLVGLESPEPLANLYSRSYFRATWVTTALDAGFWSAMRIRPNWMRNFMSIVFSIYYMICAEQADEKVRKVRGCLTLEHLRVSWNKGTTPYLSFANNLLRPRLMRYQPRAIRIPRSQDSSYTDPIHGWLYFEGPVSALKKHDKLILDIPGGGFVAMTPRHHDDKLIAWAAKTGLPVLSIDYKKAPEHPYPFALNECYDVYETIIATRGRCIGFSGETVPKIVVAGDSAGGNLAVGMTLMILQSGATENRRWHGKTPLPPPEGLVLIYPALDFNIGNWMTDEQMGLIKDRRVRKTNQSILRRKSEDYRRLTPETPHESSDEEGEDEPTPEYMASKSRTLSRSPSTVIHLGEAGKSASQAPATAVAKVPPPIPQPAASALTQNLKTRLAVSSMISYFNDRILSPEMMRSMIILYVGPHNRPDFSTDYLLSPVLAPEALLAKFPKTYFLTGERDPLVDDTVIFAGRIRQAKQARLLERKELGLEKERTVFWEQDHVEVVLIPGISHGFLQFVSLFPDGWKYIFKCGKWMTEIFDRSDSEDAKAEEDDGAYDYLSSDGRAREASLQIDSLDESPINTPRYNGGTRHHFRTRTESSGDDDRPLEMTLKSATHALARKIKERNGSISRRDHGIKPMTSSRESDRDQRRGRARRPSMKGRKKSLVSLASEEDLLGRRMRGLTTGLTGDSPPTP